MDPNYNNVSPELPPLTSSNLGRRSLPPSGSHEFQGPQPEYALPSYPSSTIHYYFPLSHVPYGSLPMIPSSSNPPAFAVLPSVSQSRVPSLRRTPSVHSQSSPSRHDNKDSPFLAPNPLVNPSYNSDHYSPVPERHLDNISRSSQYIPAPLPPSNFNLNPSPPLVAPQPVQGQPASFLPPQFSQPFAPPGPLLVPAYNSVNPSLHTNFNSSLPSTKDIPLLTGKQDWGQGTDPYTERQSTRTYC